MNPDKRFADKKRSLRLLSMISRQCALVEDGAEDAICILSFEGERRVQCTKDIIAGWLADELVRVDNVGGAHRLKITALGEKHLLRGKDDDFAGQHRVLETGRLKVNNSIESVRRNVAESPLNGLYRGYGSSRKAWLDAAEFDAGERLRSDFEFSQMRPKVTASWDPTAHIGSGKGGRRPSDNQSDRAIGARARVNQAIQAVGPELSGVLIDVCCFLKGIEKVEQERQWPRRSAKLLLKAALSVLARHYNPHLVRTKTSRLRHWGQSDYRPEI